VLAHNHNTEVCVAAGKEIASRATAFQLGAMLGVGRSGRDREDELDLADIGGETGTATHVASIGGAEALTPSGHHGSCHKPPHSITSSARSSMLGGTVRPSALAVLRLITSSNFVGRSTGRSAGLLPLRILSTKNATRRNISLLFGP
jgi:hypothetical protein